MKIIINSAFALLIAFGSVASAQDKKEYKIDTKTSQVEWLGKKVTGQHDGTIHIKEGTLELDNEKLTGGNIVIDMNSLTVTDIKDSEMNGKLKGHLMSDDFFNVNEYSTANFKITEVSKVGDKNQYTIKGDMTIRGITNEEEFPATIIVKDGKVAAIGEMTIDRSKYDVKYGSGEFFDDLGDKMIYDDFVLKFKVGAK